MQFPKRLFLLFILMVPLACQTADQRKSDRMSFEQARDVVLSMQSIPLSPPPRKLDDILAILEQPENEHEYMTEIFRRAESEPPDGRSTDMFQF